jgi:hypothetical protein
MRFKRSRTAFSTRCAFGAERAVWRAVAGEDLADIARRAFAPATYTVEHAAPSRRMIVSWTLGAPRDDLLGGHVEARTGNSAIAIRLNEHEPTQPGRSPIEFGTASFDPLLTFDLLGSVR